jgi:MacB-like periplasmic core domain
MKKFMKGFTERMTKRQIRLTIVAVVSLLICLILQILSTHLTNTLLTQQMANRWDSTGKSAQVSCFISENEQVTTGQLTNLEHAVDAALTDVSITADSENARLWADAYSARGELIVESSKTSITSTAIGVGGDFFLFHPLKLLSGSYFSDEDLMKDYIILDEDAAWQLFGSNDVEGMQVMIKGIPHIVRGVVERGSGRMNDKAGNDKVTFYVSYDSLNKYGTSKGINTYEIVMPNPISNFALNTIKEKIGIDETNIQLVENSKRYSLVSLITVLSEFGIRSMNQKAIVYPYWENVARGYEDILAFILLWKFIFLLIPAILLVIYLIYRYRHRTWNMKTILIAGSDLKEKLVLQYKNRDKSKKKINFRINRKSIKGFLKKNIDKFKK